MDPMGGQLYQQDAEVSVVKSSPPPPPPPNFSMVFVQAQGFWPKSYLFSLETLGPFWGQRRIPKSNLISFQIEPFTTNDPTLQDL